MRVVLLCVVASLLALAHGLVDCGNGNACPTDTQCTSSRRGGGLQYGCTAIMAGADATICHGDFRFSCPKDYSCDVVDDACVSNNNSTKIGLFENGPAVSLQVPAVHAPDHVDVCAVVGQHLPHTCQCQDYDQAGVINCTVNVLNVDTIDVGFRLEPCKDPMDLKFTVKEKDTGFSYSKTITAGMQEQEFDIGLDINIKKIAKAGIWIAAQIDGDIDQLMVKVGVDVCGEFLKKKFCGSKIDKKLPIWLLNKDVSFGSSCGNGTSV
jgi:hypothetical protein